MGKDTTAAPFEWEPWTPTQLRLGSLIEDPSDRRYVRCKPTVSIVLDVVVHPDEESGAWFARWLGCKSKGGSHGRANTLDEAKERALDAAELMLARDLEALEARRLALKAGC